MRFCFTPPVLHQMRLDTSSFDAAETSLEQES